ncbi:hypothetical protein ACFOG5_13000 [Pedobacter fastidiosus]|uniref:hypothetical protein n=1 Tax=Pedobacter fastidiosus TaxID=2765361 RepID=UPI00361B965A
MAYLPFMLGKAINKGTILYFTLCRFAKSIRFLSLNPIEARCRTDSYRDYSAEV